MKLRWNDDYISEYASKVTWSGTDTQASRSVEFSIASNPYDNNFKSLNIALGDFIYLYDDDGTRLFVGIVTTRGRKSEIGTLDYTAKDFMHYLLKSSGTYTFKKKTPETITQQICNDLQITTGSLVTSGVKLSKLIVENTSYYNIIIKAYVKAAETTSGIYMPIMDGFKVSVIAKGTSSGITLKQETDLTKSEYSETLDDMVNQVIIYNDSGSKIGTVNNSSWINKYGIYQTTYTKEDGVNAKTAAKKLLTDLSKTATIEALGNVACKSGYSLYIYDNATQLTGKFWITSDSHAWENGTYTMSLELAFKNIMEEVD